MIKSKHYPNTPLLLLLAGIFYTFNVSAHPHSWVDLQTTIVGDKSHITGFNMSWTFDAMTSFYMLEGQTLSTENKEKILQNIIPALMDNLVLEHYFTYFYKGDTPISYLSSLDGILTQHKTQLKLDFHIPLAEPQKIGSTPLKLQVFESSYYVDMSWGGISNVKLSPELARHCSLQLLEPNPTPKEIGYAMSLPEDASPDIALGGIFSQSVILQCSTAKES